MASFAAIQCVRVCELDLLLRSLANGTLVEYFAPFRAPFRLLQMLVAQSGNRLVLADIFPLLPRAIPLRTAEVEVAMHVGLELELRWGIPALFTATHLCAKNMVVDD